MNRQRGFALLIVLWTMGLLALLVAQFTATGRGEVQMATNLRANAVTQAAADGAVYEAMGFVRKSENRRGLVRRVGRRGKSTLS